MKNLNQIMSKKLKTIKETEPLRFALGMMREFNIRHLPVVDDQNKLVGIISDRDIQRAMTPVPSPLSEIEIDFEFDERFKIRDFMSWPVRKIHEESSLKDVVELMISQKISAYVVVGTEDQLKGIITTDDLMKLLLSFLEKDPRKMILEVRNLFEEAPLLL